MSPPETAAPKPKAPPTPPGPPPGMAPSAFMAEELKRRVRISKNLSRIRHKIIVASGKGGVGKSTVAVNLAAELAQRGFGVGLLDMDLTGPDVPFLLGLQGQSLASPSAGAIRPLVTENPQIKVVSIAFLLPADGTPVVWRGPMKAHALSQFLGDVEWGDLDFLIIDLPPGTSDEPLSVAQNIRDADGVLIVTTPQGVATLDVRKAIGFTRLLKLKCLGIVENMSGFHCPECGAHYSIFGREGGGRALADETTVPFLGAIPLDVELVEKGDLGTPFVVSLPDSEAAKAFSQITDRLLTGLSEPARKEARMTPRTA